MNKRHNSIAFIHLNSLSAVLRELFADIDRVDFTYVWRGQPDICMLPIPGIYRRLISNGYQESEIGESTICSYETDMFCESNGFGYYGEAGGNRLAFMVNLQHYEVSVRHLQ